MEENNTYDVTVEESSDRGICARALYDYQAGKLFISSQCSNSSKSKLIVISIRGKFINTQFWQGNAPFWKCKKKKTFKSTKPYNCQKNPFPHTASTIAPDCPHLFKQVWVKLIPVLHLHVSFYHPHRLAPSPPLNYTVWQIKQQQWRQAAAESAESDRKGDVWVVKRMKNAPALWHYSTLSPATTVRFPQFLWAFM